MSDLGRNAQTPKTGPDGSTPQAQASGAKSTTSPPAKPIVEPSSLDESEIGVGRRAKPVTTCRDCGRTWTSRSEGHCPTCHEHFRSYAAYDRHLRIRLVTVTTPAGHTVEHEQQVTCIPVVDFSLPYRKTGKPRLVPTEGRHGVTWVTERRSEALVEALKGST